MKRTNYSFLLIPIALLACKQDSIVADPATQDPGASALDSSTIPTDAKLCPRDMPGPGLVRVESPDGIPYCIDSTEVTQGQYFDFLDAVGADLNPYREHKVPGQPPFCESNILAPNVGWEGSGCHKRPDAFDPQRGHQDYPVACVDFCDAFAYCSWAGKRLCGKIGGGGLDYEARADATQSQWYNACSAGGKNAYQYGDAYEPARCVDDVFIDDNVPNEPSWPGARPDWKDSLPQPAGSAPECRGTEPPFDAIRDMSGTLAEWEDSCVGDDRGVYACTVRSFMMMEGISAKEAYRCESGELTGQFYSSTVGFRCCLDLTQVDGQ